MLRRLAGPLARHPAVVLVSALALCAVLAAGFVRFSVDAGQSLLVGSQSASGQANQRFNAAFGTDPIVVVLTADNPTAPYLEKNLQRLTALEEDLAHDPRVATVLGPGTVAHSALAATTAEVTKTLSEYPYFVAETDFLVARQKGQTDTSKLQAQFQSDLTNAQQLFELYVARAAEDAHNARQAYAQKPIPPADRILDGQERAAEAAVANDPLPPLFAEYLSGPGVPADIAAAREFFDRITAAFGDCNGSIAQFEGITPTCQVYLTRILLDLPHCPTQAAVQAAQAQGKELFCTPKSAWAAVLPAPSTQGNGNIVAREVITVRLTPAAAASRAAVVGLRQKIDSELSTGIASDPYTRTFNNSQLSQLKSLGPLDPTDCAGAGQQQSPSCYKNFHDRPFSRAIAGAPLLTYGVVDSMTVSLIVLLPIVIVLMALLLVALFRVRGRLWPLLAAIAAGAATVGLALWTGLAITPAVLAGVPVLAGLAVDYAVQLVARYDEARGRGADREAAFMEAAMHSGPATGTAAIATIAGATTLAIFAGVDAGPLVAIPLVAEFALVLVAGVALSWAGALTIALPAAALADGRRAAVPAAAPVAPARPQRTLAIATSWRGAVVPAVIVALVGWVLLPRVPVQTQVDQLLAASLPQLHDVNTVRDQTGYGNEIDIFLEGQVAGPYNQPGTPANVVWQCNVSQTIRSNHADQVALATSVADFFIASSSSAAASTAAPCTATPSSSSPSGSGGGTSPAASPSPSATSPAASATPSASALRSEGITARLVAAVATPSATVAPSATVGATPSATPSASASPAPANHGQGTVRTQTAFLCDLRLLPDLARNLVQPIPTSTQACPGVDKYLNTWLGTDTTPINPGSARIVIGVQGTSIADEARLIDAIRAGDVATPPGGMTATPVGIAALAAQAYDTIVSRGLWLNLLPLVVVFLALLAVERDVRRAALPVLPTAIAAGWAPLLLLLLGLLPGGVGATLGSFNPLTVVMGALVVALATEFGVVMLRRFDEECARGAHPDDAAAITLASTGRAIRVSALTLGAGFAVLALSALLPGGLPLLGAFGLTVVLDLGLAVLAVFGVMLPVAVAIERSRWTPAPAPWGEARAEAPAPEPAAPVSAARRRPARAPAAREVETTEPVVSASAADPATVDTPEPAAPRRRGVSGRRRTPPPSPPAPAASEDAPAPTRRRTVSGRRRGGKGPDPSSPS